MIDPDTIMTPSEKKEYKKSIKEYKQGKFTPLSELKN